MKNSLIEMDAICEELSVSLWFEILIVSELWKWYKALNYE
jgi:hypothetical protein